MDHRIAQGAQQHAAQVGIHARMLARQGIISQADADKIVAGLDVLRGRIGRGAHESFCILVADVQSEESRQRLKVLEKTNDGFEIAEADLKLRGPGELLGQQQSGAMKLRFGNLAEDLNLIRQARDIAKNYLSS